jgi:hypothetical protein
MRLMEVLLAALAAVGFATVPANAAVSDCLAVAQNGLAQRSLKCVRF